MLKEARTSKGATGEAVLCDSAATGLIAGEATASSSVSDESASGKTLLRDSISSESTSSETVSSDSTLNKAVPGENACDTHKSDNERETSKTRKRKRLKRRTKVRLGRAILLTLQIALLIIVYEIGCTVATFLPIDLPGNIVGMGNGGQLGCRGCYTCHRAPSLFGVYMLRCKILEDGRFSVSLSIKPRSSAHSF